MTLTMCFQTAASIDWAMSFTDIGMILLIVVLPVVAYLMSPDSHKKDRTKGSITESVKSTDKLCLMLQAHHESSGTALQRKHDGRFVNQLEALPDELRAGIAECLNLKDVAAVSTSCLHLHHALQTCSLWQTLGSRYGVQIKNQCINQSKEAVRSAAWRLHFESIKDLAIEVKRYPPDALALPTAKLFDEANHFVQRLLPADGDLAMELCELLRPSLNCHSSECMNEAKELLKSVRQSNVPWVVLQDLEFSYGHGLLQQSLFRSCMQEHDDMLESQLCELEASIEEESKNQIDYDLDTLLSLDALG